MNTGVSVCVWGSVGAARHCRKIPWNGTHACVHTRTYVRTYRDRDKEHALVRAHNLHAAWLQNAGSRPCTVSRGGRCYKIPIQSGRRSPVQVRPYHTHTAAHPSCCCSSMQESPDARAGTPIPEVVPPLPYPDKPRGAGVFAVDAVVAEPAAGAMHGTGVFAVAGGGHPSNPAADLPGDWRRAPHASDPAGRPPLGDRIGAVVASRWPAWSWSGVRCIVAPARPKCLPRTER